MTAPRIQNLRWSIKNLLSVPRRLARRRGFGIHSPFAFDFVRRVIAQPCNYYCYPTIDNIARKEHVKASRLRLLFRLSLYFRPQTFATLTDSDGAYRRIINLGCPSAKESGNADAAFMLVVENGHTAEAAACVGRGGTVIVMNRSEDVDTIWRTTTTGMLFKGSDIAIFVGMRHLPHQQFRIWI